jgi:integrase
MKSGAGGGDSIFEQLSLFEGFGVDIAELRRERAALASLRRAPSTERAYACDVKDFRAWCAAACRAVVPASADTLALYLVSSARAGRVVSTLTRRVAAISALHAAAGEASPVTADVREVLAALRRKLGTAPAGAKAAISIDELRRMVGAVDGHARRGIYSWALPGCDSFVARDRAVLLVGFASGLRSAELAGLDLADVDFVPEGLVLRVLRSKTDQEGAGRELGVHRGRRRSTCPARALEEWIRDRGAWPGPLFCHLGVGGQVSHRRLHPSAVGSIVQAAAKRAGLDPARYGGHSLRAGCVTAAAAGGAGELAIMERTGHKSVGMVRRYVRHGRLFAVDPLAGAL